MLTIGSADKLYRGIALKANGVSMLSVTNMALVEALKPFESLVHEIFELQRVLHRSEQILAQRDQQKTKS